MTALPPLVPSDPPQVEHALWDGLYGTRVFDIGARKGENFAKFGELGFTEILACEPQPDSLAEAQERFGSWSEIGHVPWLLLMQAAVSDSLGTVSLAEVPMAASKGEWVTPGTDGMEWSLADWSDAVLHEVPCTTVDFLAEDYGLPDLVVIDTEGHEARVLAGAEEVLHARKTQWLIEFHAPELRGKCEKLLAGAGHRVEVIRHPHYPQGSHFWRQHGWLRAEPRTT